MARKRMFSLDVIDTDAFMELPISTQALYFHLGMHGDDDGFVSSPRKIARSVGRGMEDLNLLETRGFIISFNTGVIVITDWCRNNRLQNDRYHEPVYLEDKSRLILGEKSHRYELVSILDTACIQDGYKMDTEHSIAKHNIAEQSIDREADKPPTPAHDVSGRRFKPPILEEVAAYIRDTGLSMDAGAFMDYYEANGWKVGGKAPMKDWKAACRNWARRDFGAKPHKVPPAAEYEDDSEDWAFLLDGRSAHD